MEALLLDGRMMRLSRTITHKGYLDKDQSVVLWCGNSRPDCMFSGGTRRQYAFGAFLSDKKKWGHIEIHRSHHEDKIQDQETSHIKSTLELIRQIRAKLKISSIDTGVTSHTVAF